MAKTEPVVAVVGEELSGRRKHLGRIALIFYHRGGTWQDFGLFLERFFAGSLHVKKTGTVYFHEQKCRRNTSGRHHAFLQSGRTQPDQYPMFNHERYSRPCLSFGKGEEGKNTGFVVSDVCTRARKFLESIGKGEIKRSSVYDEDYDPDLADELDESSSVWVGTSQVAEGSTPLAEDDDVPVPVPQMEGPSSDDFGSLEFELEDVEGLLGDSGEEGPAPDQDVLMSEISDFPSSENSADPEDSQGQVKRSSTKVRAATLGYLWGFSGRPAELRDAFQTLRRGSLSVLHLCGCGIYYKNLDGAACPGCCEWSHLKLGTLEENRYHENWHKTMNMARNEDYSALCDIVHRGQYGEGLF